MKYTLEEIIKALKRELAESYPNDWRDRFYVTYGYLISAVERIQKERKSKK